MGGSKNQYLEKFATMEKDLEIMELKQTVKKLREMLLEYHDSIQHHCQEMRNLIFDMTKVDAEILATHKRIRNTINVDF